MCQIAWPIAFSPLCVNGILLKSFNAVKAFFYNIYSVIFLRLGALFCAKLKQRAYFPFLCAPAFILSACCTESRIVVLDADTGKAIPDSFVYIIEHAMFYPFNSSAVYKTNYEGAVETCMDLRPGKASVFAGKEGYPLNYYAESFNMQYCAVFYLQKRPRGKIDRLFIRKKLLEDYSSNSILRDFYQYCTKQGISFYILPGGKRVIVDNKNMRVAD